MAQGGPASRRTPARLRIHLAYGPAAGKTTSLLQHALARRAAGIDVVLGFIEARGRAEVEALGAGLECVAPIWVEHASLRHAELDLDALLARRPALAIVDDLAQVNAPGARHHRRHQDVQELLAAGIGVATSLDVAQIESLGDVVERVAGFEPREGVPVSILQQADELLALDLPVGELVERQQQAAHGPPREALGQPRVLRALRELMLRQAADLSRPRETHAAASSKERLPGRVMVALSSLSPRASVLLREASRFAGRLDTSWFVVYVETPDEAPERVSPDAERTLLANVALARELGGEVVRVKARDPVSAIVDFGRAHGVAHLLVGRSRRRSLAQLLSPPPGGSWLDAWRGPLHERLLREARDFDVYVVASRPS